MIKNNEIIYQEVAPLFPEVFIDIELPSLYFLAPTDELGKIRINLNTDALAKGFNVVPLSDEKSGIQPTIEFDIEAGMKTVEKLVALSDAWTDIWPKLLKEFIQHRAEYNCPGPITKDNATFSMIPPGEDFNDSSDTWVLKLELKPWDGFWDIRFDLAGNEMDIGEVF